MVKPLQGLPCESHVPAKVGSGSLLPEVGADVLLQHAAESRPQVVKSPVKRVDALAQDVTPEGTDLGKDRAVAG